MKPHILIVSTSRWFSTGRLAMAFAAAGCRVDAVCAKAHPLKHTKAVGRIFRLRSFAPRRSIARAISIAKPNLLLPTDDLATRYLHNLYHGERRARKLEAFIATVIEQSLGDPENFPVLDGRAPFMTVAAEEGIRIPKTKNLTNLHEFESCLTELEFPVVLKADRTSGGTGVRLVHTAQEAKRALKELQVRRTVFQRLARGTDVMAQSFISGRDVISEVACWRGRVLASVHFEVLQKQYVRGPASVLRRIENAEISAAIEKIARRLGLSGLHGFDFILEEGSGNAYLLEINPRATQIGHLTLGPDHDLPAVLSSAVSGNPVRLAPQITENETIALFPQEWVRDPQSVFLRMGHHDVPWEDPEFIHACVRSLKISESPREQREQAIVPSVAPLTALRAGKSPGAD